MAPFDDQEDTQVVHIDSPPSGSGFDGDRTDTVPWDETLAMEVESLEDTERVADDLVLCGETQALGEEEDFEIEKMASTQVVDDSECEEEKKGETLVDSDASTDEEGGEGGHVASELLPSTGSCKNISGPVRSFAAVRVASLRSSGLAAARRINSRSIDVKSKFSFDRDYCQNKDNKVVDSTGTRPSKLETTPTSTRDLTLLGTKAGEIGRDDTEDYNRVETKSRTKNPVVKKLIYETTSVEEENACKHNTTIQNMDSPRSLVPDYVVAGLSYINSQEPGDLSQDNALDVVDKFILINDLGSSQEANPRKTQKSEMVKSPPISSAKGAQCLAKMTDHKSPVGKAGIFELIDSQEDEGGGEFFSKRKYSFFENNGGTRKTRSQPPKPRHPIFDIAGETALKSGKEGVNPKLHQKITSRAYSDSKLMLESSLRNEKVRVCETKAKKNLFKDPDEHSNSKYLEQKVEVTDVDRNKGGTYEVGPDTQIAAEAMEALIHISPVNYEKQDAHPVAEKLAKIPIEGGIRKKSSKNALRKRTSSILSSGGVLTRSKRKEMVDSKSRRGGSSFSRCNPRGKKSLEGTIIQTKLKREESKLNQNLRSRSSASGKESSVCFKAEKPQVAGDRSLIKEFGRCDNSLTLNVQLSVNHRLVLGEFHVNSAPVAHRTRHSKAAKSLKQNEKSSGDQGNKKKGLLDVRTRREIAREDKLSADASGSLNKKRKDCHMDVNQTANVERNFTSHIEAHETEDLLREPKASSPVKDAFVHPKQRRTNRSTSGNQNINGSLNNPSTSVVKMELSSRHGEIKAAVRSVSEILDTARRKKRSVSTRMTFETNGIPSGSREETFTSGVSTRSSVKSASANPKNGLEDCSVRPVLCSDATGPCSTPPLKQGVGSTTPLKNIDAASPICMAEDPSSASGIKGLSRSLTARELRRLEASEASSICVFNRRRRDMANIRVLFSHHLDDDIIKQQKKIMGRLGVHAASSISDATHFVTNKFVRTRNMLEAISLGKPIVTHMWLESCGQASCFIDEKNHILRDDKKEKEIGFSMPVSLARACQNPLLQGRRVYITPNTKPDREVVSSLVKAAHGQAMERIGRSALKEDKIPDDLLVLSCEEDYTVCIPFLEKGAEIYSSELLLNGIVIQKLEFERHRLFLDHVKRTRSTIWLRKEDGDHFLPVTKCT